MKVVQDNKEQTKIEKRLVSGFSSEDEKEVIKTVKYARKNASAHHLVKLIDLLRETKSDEVANEVIGLLNDLKDQKALEPMMEAISDDKNKAIRIFLLQALWQSRLDASDHLEALVNLAIKSDYMTCLECLTIIENFENAPSEEVISGVSTQLKDALMDNSENRDLLLSMVEVLNDFMIGE